MVKKTSCRLLQRCNSAASEDDKDTMWPQTSILQDKDTILLQMSTLEANENKVEL